MVSITEAVTRLAPLMKDLSGLAGLTVLEGVFEREEPATRARRLVVRLIHERILQLFDSKAEVLRVAETKHARTAFKLYRPKQECFGRDPRGFFQYDEDEIYLDDQEFHWMLNFLGPAPTLFLDWELAYRWVGLASPPARELGLQQRDPGNLPHNVQQRLVWIKQFSPDRKREPASPPPLPSGHPPLFADGCFGKLNLYSIENFGETFNQDGFSAVTVGMDAERLEQEKTEGSSEIQTSRATKPIPVDWMPEEISPPDKKRDGIDEIGEGTKWNQACIEAKFERIRRHIPHKLLVPRISALLSYLDEKNIRECAPDGTKKNALPILQLQYKELMFTESSLDEAWKHAHVLGLLMSVNRIRRRDR